MARETAGKWIIGLIIYFLLISVVLTSISKMVSEYDISDSSVSYSAGSLGKGVGNMGGCFNPRENAGKYDDDCKELMDVGSVYDNASCEAIIGCTWEESNWWQELWGATTYICSGNINLTHYNDDVAFSFYGVTGIPSYSICELTNLSEDPELCEDFGCSWTGENPDDYISVSGIAGFWGIISDIFTANLNFGSTSQSLNTLLNFIFIVLPILMLIMAIIMFALG